MKWPVCPVQNIQPIVLGSIESFWHSEIGLAWSVPLRTHEPQLGGCVPARSVIRPLPLSATLFATLSVLLIRVSANSPDSDVGDTRSKTEVPTHSGSLSESAPASLICDSTSVYSVGVTPPPPGSGSWTAQTTGHTTTFTVQNTGACNDTYQFTVSALGPIPPVVTLNKTSAAVIHGGSTTVIATYDVGNPGTGSLTLRAASAITGASAENSYVVTVVTGAPTNWDVTPFNQDNQVVGRCSVACFGATYAQSTVPYFSLDEPRSVTLAYNGDRVWPKPFVHLNVQKPSGTPDTIFLQVKKAGVWQTFVNGDSLIKFIAAQSGWQRIGAQLRDSTWGTGIYTVDLVVTWHYPGGSTTVQTWTTQLLVVNETNSPIARGWTVAGLSRAYPQGDGSVLLTEGEGSAVFFRKRGATTFFSPTGEFSTLAVNGTGWKRTYPDSTAILFNSAGRVTDFYDRFNNRTQFFYDASNRLTTIRDPNSQDLVLAYGTYGLSSIRDNILPNRYTNVTVLSDSTITGIQDPDGISTRFQYDGSRRFWKVINRRGDTTRVDYQIINGKTSGKVAAITAPPVPIYGEGTVAPVTSFAPWQTVGVPYSATGSQPVPVVIPDTVYGRITDAGGHTTRFTVNHWGTAAVTTDAIGRTDSSIFDSNGMTTRQRSAVGAVDSAVYNEIGLPIYAKSSGQPAVRLRYVGWAQADSTWTDDGLSGARYFIGANGRVDSARVAGGTPDSAKARYRYDSRGRVDSVADPLQHLVGRTWYIGTNGNRSKDSLPGGRVATYGYDVYGRDTSVSRPGVATSKTFYSIINRIDSVSDGFNPVPTRYGHDNLFLTSVTDPKGQVYAFSYNGVGWLTQRTDPALHSVSYQYSRDGELRRWTNRRGQSIDYVYDSMHRRTSKSGTNTATETWTYLNDTVLVAISPVATDTILANRHGQLLRVSTVMASQNYVRRYTYTASGALDSVVPSGAGISFIARHYLWNLRRGTLTGIKLGASPDSTSVAYNADGLAASTTLPGGYVVSRTYDAVHATAGIGTTAPYASTVNRSGGYDAANRIRRQIVSPTSGYQYSYDGLGRLSAESLLINNAGPPCDPLHTPPDDNGDPCSFAPNWVVSGGTTFFYDSAGNRRDLGGTYTLGNRITAFNGCSYVTDSLDGNVLSRSCGGQTVTFSWTAENRLSSIVANGQTTTFDYNASGRLVKKTTAGVRRYFLWDADNLLAEIDSLGTGKIAEYSSYPGLDNPHALIVGSTKYFHQRDMLGNVIALTDSAGAVQRTYQYNDWGESGVADTAVLSGKDRARFKGALWFGDGAELYYMRRRWYEPHSGRFLSEDPDGLGGGINTYAFAGNDPVNGADPTGRRVCWVEVTYYTDNGQIISWRVLFCYDTGGGGGGGGGGAGDAGPGQTPGPDVLCRQTVAGQQITTRASIANSAREFINDLVANGFDVQIGVNSSYRNELSQTVISQMAALFSSSGRLADFGVHVAARPGWSSHGGGYALDINSFSNFAGLSGEKQWLIESIAGRHSFTHPLGNDPVHFESMDVPPVSSGPARPAAIHSANEGARVAEGGDFGENIRACR